MLLKPQPAAVLLGEAAFQLREFVAVAWCTAAASLHGPASARRMGLWVTGSVATASRAETADCAGQPRTTTARCSTSTSRRASQRVAGRPAARRSSAQRAASVPTSSMAQAASDSATSGSVGRAIVAPDVGD